MTAGEGKKGEEAGESDLSLATARPALAFMGACTVAAIAVLFAWVMVSLGEWVADLAALRAPRWGVIGVVAVVAYLYIRYTVRLRREVRRMQMLELMLLAWKRQQQSPQPDAERASAPVAGCPETPSGASG